jgi:hypothetical protein
VANDEYTQASGTTLDFTLDSSDDEYTQASGTTLDFSLIGGEVATGIAASASGTTTTATTDVTGAANAVSSTTDAAVGVTVNATSTAAQSSTINSSGFSISFPDAVAASATGTTTNADVKPTYGLVAASATGTTASADLIIDDIIITNAPDPVTFTSVQLSNNFVEPSSQNALSPAISLLNQSPDDYVYDVYFNWSSSLDSCYEIGVSDEAETSFGNTTTTGTSETKVLRLQPGERGGIFMYADINGCGFGTTFNNTWEINGTIVAECDAATATCSTTESQGSTA